MATWTPAAAPVTDGARSSPQGGLQRALLAAAIDLGERMWAAGIDDGFLGAQITALDQSIRRADTTRLPLGPLLAQRRDLLLRLAAAALAEDAPLPGADAEYERARAALAALKEAGGSAATARPEENPGEREEELTE